MQFGRDIALLIDNLLNYVGEGYHELIIQEQHKVFVKIRCRIRRAQEEKWKNKLKWTGSQDEVGVYYKAHTRQRKLNLKWKSYYKMTE